MNCLNIICDNNTRNDKIRSDSDVIKNLFFYIEYENYKIYDYKNLKIDHNINYIHLLYHTTTISDYIRIYDDIPINDDMKKLIKENSNISVLFFYPTESDHEDSLISLDRILNRENMNAQQFIISNGNSNNVRLKNKINSKIRVHTTNYLHSGQIKQIGTWIENESIQPVFNKKYMFSCHNRRMMSKAHRLTILCFLKKLNILDRVNWSLLRGYEISTYLEFDDDYFRGVVDQNEIKDEIEYFSKIKIKKAEFEEDVTLDTGTDFFDFRNSFINLSYLQSYVNIVTESEYKKNDLIHITEKSINPFLFLQIPLFVATTYHVKMFKEKYDLDFFDDLVDHSYDSIEDGQQRMKMIVDQIIKIHNMGDELDVYYRKNIDRLINNKKKILEIGDFNDTKKFLNSLTI